jgi:hypothetical protein
MVEPEAPVRRGGCHCGAVRFEVRSALSSASVCNCSICTMKAYVHWIVPRETFTLLSGEGELATYRFGTRVARHHFCTVCGVASFYVARSDPDKIDVNLRCVDGVELDALELSHFDGRHWEDAFSDRA